MPTPVILIPREPAQLKAAHEFHLERVGEFLLPRDIGQFDKLAEAGELWIALDGSAVVATCYVTREDGAQEAEFGGIIVRKDWEGTGLATAIGTVAISAHALHDLTPRLVAHVHIDNSAPLPLLARLGFRKLDDEPAQLNKADLERSLGRPITMKADENGIIRGNTFLFSPGYLHTLADRVESGRLAKGDVEVANRYFESGTRAETVRVLRELAK